MNRIERKDHNVGSWRIDKTSLFSYDDEIIYLKMHIVGEHISINETGDHIKIISPNIDNLS